MIFFLSSLAILQCYILPGLIMVKKYNESFIYKLISIILVSILFNFFLVSILIALNLYIKEVFYIFFIIQLVIIYRLYIFKDIDIEVKLNFNFLIIIFVFLLILLGLYKNTGNVFYAWDAVISYNEWAINFSEGEYPNGMVRPYLIPKLWSLIYVFANNNTISIFTKFTTFIFPSLILLMCLDEIIIYKKLRDFIKLFLFCIFLYLKKNFILTGYVDIPLVAIIYCFFYYFRRQNINLSLVSIIIGFGIKISSIFVLFFFLLSQNKNFLKKISISIYVLIYFIFLYSSKLENLFTSNIFNEMGQNDNFNVFINLKYSLKMLSNNGLIYFLIGSIFGIFINNFTRKIFFLYIVPGWLYWSLMLSYDDRNFLFLMPGLIIINSILLEKFILKFAPYISKYINININHSLMTFKIMIKSYVYIFLGIIFFCSTIFINDKSIIEFNKKKQIDLIGNKKMNIELVELIKDNKLNSNNFITDFQLVFFTPFLKDHFNWNDNFLSINTKNLHDYDYYLIYGHSHLARKIINERIRNNELRLILNINGFILAGIIKT